MSDQQNPFDLLLDQFRVIVREEIKAAMNGNKDGVKSFEKPKSNGSALSGRRFSQRQKPRRMRRITYG